MPSQNTKIRSTSLGSGPCCEYYKFARMVPDAAAKLLTSPAFDYKIYLCIFLSKSRKNDLQVIGANLYTNRNKSKNVFHIGTHRYM